MKTINQKNERHFSDARCVDIKKHDRQIDIFELSFYKRGIK